MFFFIKETKKSKQTLLAMIFTFNSGKQYRKFRITCQVSEGKVLKVDVRFVSGERKLGPHRHHWKIGVYLGADVTFPPKYYSGLPRILRVNWRREGLSTHTPTKTRLN